MSFFKHIGMNGFAQSLKQLFGHKERNRLISKRYGAAEDHFFDETNRSLKEALGLVEHPESYERDRKQYGTPIGLIDVADDAIPKKRRNDILPLPGKVRLATEGYSEDYETDLDRFGTPEGVIDVSNDSEKKHLSFSHQDAIPGAYEAMMNKWTKQKAFPFSTNPFAEIFREFPKLQITVQNKSTQDEEITLWGGNTHSSVSSSSSTGELSHTLVSQITIPGGVYPQTIIVNPANHFVYIVNQISGSVTVLNSANQVINLIELEALPMFSSPVGITVNTVSSSSTYGYVYVACSVSNKLIVIDLLLQVVAAIDTDVRPMAAVFNPVNLSVYTSNLVAGTISVFHGESFLEVPGSPFEVGQNPIGIGVEPTSGDVYVCNSLGNSVTVYSSSNAQITTIGAIGTYPVSVTYNPSNQSMYAVANGNDTVYQIDTVHYNVTASIATGIKPYGGFFHSQLNYLFIQNTESNTFTILKSDNTVVPDTSFIEINIGAAYNAFNNSIYVSDPIHNQINIIQYTLSSIVINEDYFSMREDFQGNPGIIQHVRFIVTGPERIHSFRHNRFTPTGLVKSRAISFELFASPQSKLNVSEAVTLAGTIIDGKMNWKFKLPGLHTVAILIWYRQFEVRDLFGNTHTLKKHYHEQQINVPDHPLYCHT
jgi:YVTN family beta-propeller protein